MLFDKYKFCFENSNKCEFIVEKYFYKLILLYSEGSRHYHTLKHIIQMINMLKGLLNSELNEKMILLSIFFHDVIYNPRSPKNEEVIHE